jgi:hypothetical protein
MAKGIGNVSLRIPNNSGFDNVELTDVLYIPEMKMQLLSDNRATA